MASFAQETATAPVSTAGTLCVQRKCACGKGAGLTDECEECQRKRMTGVTQRGDRFEREADRVAAQVTSGETARLSSSTRPRGGSVPSFVREVLQSPGQPLDAGSRSYFEPRFGHSFGDVRVHTGRRAEESALRLNARAYTVGNHVVAGAGGLDRKLLAHELTHTLQQTPGVARQPLTETPQGTLFPNPPPQRPLGKHKPKTPKLGSDVDGLLVTESMCHCTSQIEEYGKRQEKYEKAYMDCLTPGITRVRYRKCVREKKYGDKADEVPGSSRIDPSSSTVAFAPETALEKRTKLLGEPWTGPCGVILRHAARVRAQEFFDWFDEIAKGLGPEFFKEFKRLEGDEKRMEKLSRRFPKETGKYVRTHRDVKDRAKGYVRGLTRVIMFLERVRGVLKSICAKKPEKKKKKKKPKRRPMRPVPTGVIIFVPDPVNKPDEYFPGKYAISNQKGEFFEIFEDDEGLFYGSYYTPEDRHYLEKTTTTTDILRRSGPAEALRPGKLQD